MDVSKRWIDIERKYGTINEALDQSYLRIKLQVDSCRTHLIEVIGDICKPKTGEDK